LFIAFFVALNECINLLTPKLPSCNMKLTVSVKDHYRENTLILRRKLPYTNVFILTYSEALDSDEGLGLLNMLDVLIVGAGPTGLTLACLCLRLGMRIAIIDKNSGPSITSKAIGLQYRISEVLAIMGIVDRFINKGGCPTPVNIYHGDKKLVTFHFNLPPGQYGKDAFTPRPILIPQSETEALLGELLKESGGEIQWGKEFVDFSQDQSVVVSKVQNVDRSIEEIRSSWLVSCEGAHSLIRKQAGFTFQGKSYPLSFALADVEADWNLNHNENHVWMHPDGSFAALPLPATQNTWRLFFEVSENASIFSDGLTLPVIRNLLVSRSGLDYVNLTNPKWISEFKINCRMVDHFRNTRVFVAGDAAHIHSPTGGQGITTGLQDVTNLAWKLGCVKRGAPESLLDTYEQERLPKAKEVLEQTDRTTSIFFAPQLWMRLLRDVLILPLLRMKFLQNRMFGKLSQLHVSYRGSVLSRDEFQFMPWKHRPRKAGDRAPDVAFNLFSSQKKTTLFQLLSPFRPVILVGQIKDKSLNELTTFLQEISLDFFFVLPRDYSNPIHETPCLVDIHGDFGSLYGLRENFVCVIRPDGYLGLIQQPISLPNLRKYVKMIAPV
jgi:2-polyprenyl-6-methoxyphenol hydroxylase-like FAD-dependent oxidoreductase